MDSFKKTYKKILKMKLSLKDRLVQFLRKYHIKDGFIASGKLQRIVAEKTSYTPRTTCRRLEELVVEGKLEVQYRKGHAFYRAVGLKTAPQQELGSMKAMLEWFGELV